MEFHLVKEMYDYLDLFLFAQCLVNQLKNGSKNEIKKIIEQDDFNNKLLSLVLVTILEFQDELFQGTEFVKVWKKMELYDRELILECLN
jgi:hypothetical protein